jgi:hypothetical protein
MEPEDQPHGPLTPGQQFRHLLHFLTHNHYAQIVLAVVVGLALLLWFFKYMSRGKLRGLEQSAKGGDIMAAAELGEMYQYGREGAPINHRKAQQWYRLAAAAGDAGGQNGLGSLFFNGDGVEQNFGEAFKYFELSANQGHPMGQANLSLMYFKGRGTGLNKRRAYFWALLAKTNARSTEIMKYTESFSKFFNELYNSLSPEERKAPEDKARDWKPEKPEKAEKAEKAEKEAPQ